MDKKSDAKIIAEFINFQKKQGNSEGTLKLYTQIINEFSKWLEMDGSCLDSLTRLDIQQYVNYLSSKGISASTIENKFAAISCLAKSLGQTNILQNIRKPKFRKNYNIAPKSLERNDRNKILREIERSKNLRNIAITYLFLYTGIRVSELVALDRPDLISGERSGSVLVRKGKGNIERKVPLPAEARLHLKNYLNSRDDSYKELFLSTIKNGSLFVLFKGYLKNMIFIPINYGILTVENLSCLLYTSDAADEEDSVDLGGRRIIKKK